MHKKKKIEGLGLIKRQVVDNYQEPVVLGGGIMEQISDANVHAYSNFKIEDLKKLLLMLDKQGKK